MSEWISVKDRLPETEDMYLCYLATGKVTEFYLNANEMSGDRKWGYGIDQEATHWMPLPEPPKEQDNEPNI